MFQRILRVKKAESLGFKFRLGVVLLASICLCAASASRPAEPLDQIDALIGRGLYHEAVARLDKLAQERPADARLQAMRGQMALKLGRYKEAEKLLLAAPAPIAASRPLRLAAADYLREVGRYEEVIPLLQEEQRGASPDMEMRSRLAVVCWLAGQKEKSLALLKDIWNQTESSADFFDKLKSPQQALAAGEALSLLAELSPQESVADKVLNGIYQPGAKRWSEDARFPTASADLLKAKYNFAEAAEDYQRALKLNPSSPEALVGLALVLVEKSDYRVVSDLAKKALAVNPHYPDAHLVLAWCDVGAEEFESALGHVQEALKVNPRHIEALGIRQGLLKVLGRTDNSTSAPAGASGDNSLLARQCLAEGQVFLSLRRFDLALDAFERSRRLDGDFASASHWLGLAQMLGGAEQEAYRNLSRAHQLDPFNVRTYNLLELMDWMREKMVETQTEHFRLSFPKSYPPAMGKLLAADAEEILDSLGRELRVTAGGKVFVEIFPDHRTFSVRTSGHTWVATVGACTGPVVALYLPTKSQPASIVNWHRVLRHELTHVLTLMGTGYRVPYWFTEGCAVYEESEGRPVRSAAWMGLLAARFRSDGLIPVLELSRHFARPQTAEDRQMAYFQSALAVEMIVKLKGAGVLSEMLADFARGAGIAEALSGRVGLSPEDFDRRLDEYSRAALAEMTLLGGWTAEDVQRARKAMNSAPGNPNGQLNFAVSVAGYSRSYNPDAQQLQEGRQAAQKALADDSLKAEALRAVGWLELKQNHLDVASDCFKKALEARADDAQSLLGLAKASAAMGRVPAALELLKKALSKSLLEPAVLKWASDAAAAANMQDESMQWLALYLQTGIDDPAASRRLGRFMLSAGRFKEAAGAYRDLLNLDPFSVGAYIGLAEALGGLQMGDKGLFYLELACQLDPNDPTAASLLARELFRSGDKARALQTARKAVSLGADGGELKPILDTSEKGEK